jgi:hypothetical protein
VKRYRVTADVTISVSVVVHAKSKKGAVAAAEELPMMKLCHQCASNAHIADGEEWATSGELDGTPKNSYAVEEPDE